MIASIKAGIRRVVNRLGYDIHQCSHELKQDLGEDPFRDMKKLAVSGDSPSIIDAGANLGQSIERFHAVFPNPTIHAFEPDPDAFAELERRTAHRSNVIRNRQALGSVKGTEFLHQNVHSTMSSILEPGPDCWGAVKEHRPVEVTTLDNYCGSAGIDHIDILKSDTQGYDLEVVKGATSLLAKNRIHLVFLEINFSEIYRQAPRLDEIYVFFIEHGFRLVSFYKFYYQHDRAAWTDAMFVNLAFNRNA